MGSTRRARWVFPVALMAALLAGCQGVPADDTLADRTTIRIGEREFVFPEAQELSARTEGDHAVVNGIRIRVGPAGVVVDGKAVDAAPGDRIIVERDGTVRVESGGEEAREGD